MYYSTPHGSQGTLEVMDEMVDADERVLLVGFNRLLPHTLSSINWL